MEFHTFLINLLIRGGTPLVGLFFAGTRVASVAGGWSKSVTRRCCGDAIPGFGGCGGVGRAAPEDWVKTL